MRLQTKKSGDQQRHMQNPTQKKPTVPKGNQPAQGKRRFHGKLLFGATALIAALIVSVLAVQFFMRYEQVARSISTVDNTNAVSNLEKDAFAVMLLGEGTNGEDGEAAADSITLFVINPAARVARIISVPRDSYLPRGAACDSAGLYDKIANSGYDIGCLQTTLEAVFDLNINYYMSINFVSFVKVVDTLGGIEMDVPDLREGFENWKGDASDGTSSAFLSEKQDGLQWCEHDSARRPYAVCFDKFGKQMVDGEHALALARSRHYDSDFARNRRQSELIRAIANKITADFNIFLINDLLQAAEGNIQTNIPQKQFFDFARLGQKLMSSKSGFALQPLQLDGESSTFQGDIYLASYNEVSLFSLENIRYQIAKTLSPESFPPISIDAFYYDPGELIENQFASKYKNYGKRGFLKSYMDIQDTDDVRKYNTKFPYQPQTTRDDE